jgi:hypothetical protein
MGEAAAFDRLLFEAQGGGLLAGRVGDEFDGIVLARPAALFLEPAQAFVELGKALLAPWC